MSVRTHHRPSRIMPGIDISALRRCLAQCKLAISNGISKLRINMNILTFYHMLKQEIGKNKTYFTHRNSHYLSFHFFPKLTHRGPDIIIHHPRQSGSQQARRKREKVNPALL